MRKTDRNGNGNTHPTRIFSDPMGLLNAWELYKESLKEEAEKWSTDKFVGSDARREVITPKLPLLMDGFRVWCYYRYGHVHQYFENKEGYYDDFVGVVNIIRDEIRNDHCTGGLLNMYNASLTARLNGLVDKTESVNENTSKIVIEDLTKIVPGLGEDIEEEEGKS